eukprot:TRINITY_DN18314_c0_g1_i1.p1 TRINITY_DN18314_c0_g1~~TRINITY_DN18314_c0_g1_i1.p1  ORF type:complete len:627 (-),score=164.43 TRINITY_DN18314_c0_g1_i1:8-1888(-)
MSLSKSASLKSTSVAALVFTWLKPASASPSQDPQALQMLQTRRPVHDARSPHGLTAVPLPIPLGASAGSITHGLLGPAQMVAADAGVQGRAAGNILTWIVAGAGGAWHGLRQNREPRRRRNRRLVATRAAGDAQALVELESNASDMDLEEGGWQTASEDEEEEMRMQQYQQQYFQQHVQLVQVPMQFQQPVMGQFQTYPQQFDPEQGQQFNGQQFSPQQFNQQQQLMCFQPMQMSDQQFAQQQVQMQAIGQQPQLQHLQPYMQMVQQNGMVLVAVPVGQQPQHELPEQQLQQTNQEQEHQLQEEQLQQQQQSRQVSRQAPLQPGLQKPQRQRRKDFKQETGAREVEAHLSPEAWRQRAPSVCSSDVSVELTPSTASTQTPQSRSTSSASRWTSKESDLVAKQLKSGATDAVQRKFLLQRIMEDAWGMAVTKHGTRVVQAALEAADATEKYALASALKGKVWQALKSPHANHVLQKAIAVLPPHKVDFVIAELKGRVGDTARHPFGCRVLERLMEHCAGPQTEALSAEILNDALELCRHQYGNYVVQHTLEHGTPEQKHRLCQAMIPEAGKLARHKVASHVIECALLHASAEDRQSLKDAMAGSAEELASLTASNYGSFVAKEMKKR